MHLLSGICLCLSVLIGIFQLANAQTPTELRVTTVMWDQPYLIKKQSGNDTKLTGLIPDLLEALSRQSGLQFKLQPTQDGSYGAQNEDGSWSGMMGELIQDQADLAMLLTQTSNRLKYVDFSHAVMTVDPTIVMETPQVVFQWHEKFARLLVPVDFMVWLVLVLAFIVTSVILYITASVNPYEWRALGKRHEASQREVESFTCINTFWFVISTLFWQGFVRAPRSIGGRIISISWFFFVMIFILAYTASLINYLHEGPEPSVDVGYSKIKSFKELSKTDDIIVGMLSFGATHQFFQNAKKDTVAAKVYKKAAKFMKKTPIMNHEQGIALLTDRPDKHKSFAFIMESASARYLVSKRCDLSLITDTLAHRYLAVAVQKGSPLLQTVNNALLKLQETGEATAIVNKWFRQSECQQQQHVEEDELTIPEFYPIELETISGAILILVAGLVLGSLMTCFERCAGGSFGKDNRPDTSEHARPQPRPEVDDGNHVTHANGLPVESVDMVDYLTKEPTGKMTPDPSTEI